MRVIITALAKEDIRQAVEWYHERSEKVPVHFISDLGALVYGIRQHPKRWPPLAKGDRRRVAFSDRSPYELIYLPTEKPIKLLAIRHEKRDEHFGTDRE